MYLHDFGTGEHFDVFSVVMKLYNISYYQAIKRIIGDKIPLVDKPNINEEKELTFVPGNSNYDYFYKLEIKEKTLKKFNVFTARALYIDEVLTWKSTEKNPIFIYQFESGNYKAYRPLSKDKENK